MFGEKTGLGGVRMVAPRVMHSGGEALLDVKHSFLRRKHAIPFLWTHFDGGGERCTFTLGVTYTRGFRGTRRGFSRTVQVPSGSSPSCGSSS